MLSPDDSSCSDACIENVGSSVTPADGGDGQEALDREENASTLLFRSYRFAASQELRQSFQAQDHEVLARILSEVSALQKKRDLVIEEMRNSAELSVPTMEVLERSLNGFDADLGAWCLRLILVLHDGDYLLPNEMVGHWVRMLYPLVVDVDFVFRHTNAWVGVSSCFIDIGSRRKDPNSAPVDGSNREQTLRWEPLVHFTRQVFHLPSRFRDVPSLKHVQDKVKELLLRLCSVSSDYFDDCALEGLWEEYAPSFHPDGFQAIQGLAYFVSLAPRFQLAALPQQRALLTSLLEVFFSRTTTWHATTLSWSYFCWSLLGKATPTMLAYIGQEAACVEPYAEALFSTILYALRLPVGDSDVRKSLRIGGRGTIDMLIENYSGNSSQRAHALVAEYLPDDTSTPLWAHLRRLVHATEVFVRPTANPHQGLLQLAELLNLLVHQIVRRVDKQSKFKAQGVRAPCFLSQPSINAFANILLPPLLSALYSNTGSIAMGAQKSLHALCRVAPAACFKHVICLGELGMSPNAEVHQCTVALELLGNCTPELLLGDASVRSPPMSPASEDAQTTDNGPLGPWDDPTASISERLESFLTSTSYQLLSKIDGSDFQRTMCATRIVFQSAVYFSLRTIRSADAAESEQSFLLPLIDKIISFGQNCEALPKRLVAAFFTSLHPVFRCAHEDTMELIADRVCRRCGDLGEASAVHPFRGLLQAVAARSPSTCWKKLFPTIRSKLTDPLASVSEVRWYCSMLIGIIHCADRNVVFGFRQEIMSLIDTLMIRLTSRERVHYAGEVYQCTVASLLRRHMKPAPASTAEVGISELRLAKDAELVLDKPGLEHITYCVSECSKRLVERLDDLTDMASVVRKRSSIRDEFLGTTAGTFLPGDDDEVLNEAALRRSTLRIIRLLVEANVPILAADRCSASAKAIELLASNSGLEAPHLFSPRLLVTPPKAGLLELPDGGQEMLVHSDQIIETMLRIIPVVAGSENYVAVPRPPSLSDNEVHRALSSGTGDADVRALQTIIKVLFSLCTQQTAHDSFVEPLRLLLENWRGQFKRANGTRQMPQSYWGLSAEVQESSRLHARTIPVSRDVLMRVVRYMHQLATHHRFEEVRSPARNLATAIVALLGATDELCVLTMRSVDDLVMMSKESAKMVASGVLSLSSTNQCTEDDDSNLILDSDDLKRAPSRGHTEAVDGVMDESVDDAVAGAESAEAHKRFDHEINGTLRFLSSSTIIELFVAPRTDVCMQIYELLTEFPDVLLSKEEQARKNLFWSIGSERMLHGCAMDTILPVAAKCIDNCVKLAASFPSRAGRWLELCAAFWPRTFRMPEVGRVPECVPVLKLVRLCVHEHLRIRTLAQHVFSTLLTSLKHKTPTKEVVLSAQRWSSDASQLKETQETRRRTLADFVGETSGGSPWYGMRNIGCWYTPLSVCIKQPTALIGKLGVETISASLGIDSQVPIRETWLWKLARKYQEESKQYSKTRTQIWKVIARVCGTTRTVASYQALHAEVIVEWRMQAEVSIAHDGEKAKESQLGLVAVLGELAMGAVRATKYDPIGRRMALAMLDEFLSLVISPQVSHEVLSAAQRSVMDLRHALTAVEVGALMLGLLQKLQEILERIDTQGGGTSQVSIRLLTIILQLLNTFSYDVMSKNIGHLLKVLSPLRGLLLGNKLTQVRNHCASVLRQLLQCAWYTSERCGGGCDEDLLMELNAFARSLLEAGVPLGAHVVPPDALFASKSNVVLWAYPPPALLSPHLLPSILRFFAVALDIRLPEQDDIFNNINGTLISIAFTRMDKGSAQIAINECADVLLEQHAFGQSRNAKVTMCRMLRVLLFVNLHRTGRFTTIQKVSEAALKSMAHSDKRVRTEGKTLFSIIVRVASVEQMHAVVRDLLQRLRMVEAELGAATPTTAEDIASAECTAVLPTTASSNKLSLCVALCGAILADPDTVPEYVPKVLERLAKYARDRNPDVSATVKHSMMEWWTSHRDKWGFAHKRRFTASQLNTLTELFSTPSYFV